MTKNIFIAALPEPQAQNQIIETIEHHQDALKAPYPIEWELAPDLHVTLGYLRDIEESDIPELIKAFSVIEAYHSIETIVEDAKLYGTALCLQCQPLKSYESMHQALKEALLRMAPQYTFSDHHAFQPHITIGRLHLPRHKHLNAAGREPLISGIRNAFKTMTFQVKEAALMHRAPSRESHYKRLKTYLLNPSR